MSQRKPPKTDKSQGQDPEWGRRMWQRVLRIVVAVLVLGGVVAVAISVGRPEAPPPPELEAVETFPDMGVEHLAPGAQPPDYNSDPPTSGPHAQTPAPCGVYRQPVPDMSQLHSMEHGAVVVQYDPELSQEQVGLIEAIDWATGDEVIVAPRPNNPAPVALTSWTRRLLLDEVDTEVITAYAREFANQSPELRARCPMQVDETG